MTAEEQAVENLRTYAGLDQADATRLVEAVKDAVTREALDVISGDSPVPSGMVDARALRLRLICEAAGRVLRPREVEVLFRLPPAAATSVDRRMRATYPRAVDTFLRDRIKELATAEPAGEKPNWRYRIYFDDPVGLEYAQQLLQRQGLTRNVRVERAQQILDVPAKMGPEGKQVDPLTVLGLK